MSESSVEETKDMWVIFVPTTSNEGKPFRARFHRAGFDEFVKKTTGGMTIMPVAMGLWVSDEGDEYRERMIPVHILATKSQMVAICNYVKKQYDQLAVLAYKVSTDYIYVD